MKRLNEGSIYRSVDRVKGSARNDEAPGDHGSPSSSCLSIQRGRGGSSEWSGAMGRGPLQELWQRKEN